MQQELIILSNISAKTLITEFIVAAATDKNRATSRGICRESNDCFCECHF